MSNRLSNRKYYYGIILLSPLLGVFYAIRNLKWQQKKPVLILAITLFGATIILNTSDGFVLQQMIYDHYVGLTFKQWWFEFIQILKFSPETGTKGDVFSHVFSYVIGHLLGIPGQYFIFVSFIYAWFFVQSISKILRWESNVPRSSLFWGLIVVFVSYRFIDVLQSVRTYTGAWVLFYAVLRYHETAKSRFLILALSAPLFHFVYFIIVLPTLIGILLKRLSPWAFIVVYGLSFFISVNSANLLRQAEQTDLGQSKVQDYYRDDPTTYFNPLEEKSARWYKRYGNGVVLYQAPHLLISVLIFLGFNTTDKFRGLESPLFKTGLLLASLANLGSFVPVFYNRTIVNAGIYITAVMVLLLARGALLHPSSNTSRKIILWIVFFSFFPYIVYVIANMIQFTSVFMLMAPVLGLFEGVNFSIREFIEFFI